jgi:hypothetical protein
LYYSQVKVLIDAVDHSEHAQIIKCDFKPGSVERTINLDQENILQQQKSIHIPPPIKIEKTHSGVPLYPIFEGI